MTTHGGSWLPKIKLKTKQPLVAKLSKQKNTTRAVKVYTEDDYAHARLWGGGGGWLNQLARAIRDLTINSLLICELKVAFRSQLNNH